MDIIRIFTAAIRKSCIFKTGFDYSLFPRLPKKGARTKMKIYEYTCGMKLPRGALTALGLFDGVHEGHRRLLRGAREIAAARGLTFTVFTFRTETLKKGDGALYSTEEKLHLFASVGVEAVILADFDDISGVSAEDFIKKLLIEDMGCEAAVAGFDFRFGNGAAGDAAFLASVMRREGRECIIETEHKLDGEKISTTRIKELLREADVERARIFLGAPYFITASVQHGRGEGRTLGFPTLNLDSPSLKNLKRGVYRCAADIDGRLCTAVTNVGTCPTFEEREVHAEAHLIDFEGDLYGKSIRIFFLGYLRDERRFESPESLVLQINVDKNRAIKENGDISWQEIGLSLQQWEASRNSTIL